MANDVQRAGRTATRLRWLFALFLLGVAVLLAVGGELLLRMNGVTPWSPTFPSISIEPGGRVTQPHPILGFTAIPGSFVARGEDGVETRFTNLENTLRITRPLSSYEAGTPDRPQIWIFGCSFTYGSGLDDHQTYPWRLQRRMPAYEIVNFGMGGYGTIHSYLQLRAALEKATPKVAVLAFSSMHDIRNTFLRARRKQVVPYSRLGPFEQPFARLDRAGELEFDFAQTGYREFPLMRHSALVHALEVSYNELERRLYDSRAVSEALVLEMHRIASENGSELVVAGILDAASMLQFASDNGIPSVDISLPQEPRFILSPADPHPNARAARIYADRLGRFLERRL